ncbi:MAG: Uma2 family endonuclease [Egibacteraceae bacterium]
MGSTAHGGLTYADLLAYPEENWPKRELFDGELVVSPPPAPRHARVQFRLLVALAPWAEATGADVSPGWDLEVADGLVMWPDAMVVLAERVHLVNARPSPVPPDVVVEISSPSTRRRDLIRKRAVYERFGVPEYWFVDLDEDRILVFRLEDGRYGEPDMFAAGDLLESKHLPGFAAPVDRLLNLTSSGEGRSREG